MMTAKQIQEEVARIDALGDEQKRNAIPAFRAALRACGLSDFCRTNQYEGKLGQVNILDVGTCGVYISFTPPATVRAAARQRAQRDRIRRQADAL